MQRAVGCAISASVEAMPDGLLPEDAGTGLTPHNDAKLACDRNLSGIVAGRKEKLGGSDVAGSNCGPQGSATSSSTMAAIITSRSRDLVMQFEVTASKGFEADAIGGFQVAIGCQIRAPRGQGADELHAGEAAQLIAQAIGSADDRTVDHLQGEAPGAHRGLPASHENPRWISIMPSRLRGVTVRWPAKAAWAAF